MATFRKNTYVRDANGVNVRFVIGQEVPEWALSVIKNPNIIDGDLEDDAPTPVVDSPAPDAPAPAETVEEPTPAPAPKRRPRKTATKPATAE